MKKTLLFLLTIVIASSAFTACEKTNEAIDPGVPQSVIPDAMVGTWQLGSFSLTTFWGYDGSYQGNAGTYSLAYKLTKDGHAEQYLYIVQNSYGLSTKLLGYRKGRVSYDETTKSLEFFATEGNYRMFTNSGKTQKDYGQNDLYPKYKDVLTNCSVITKNQATYLVVTKGSNQSEYKKTE
jgi:hypothetical protein